MLRVGKPNWSVPVDADALAIFATSSAPECWRGRSWRDWRTVLRRGSDGTVWYSQIESEPQVLEATAAEWDAWVQRVGAVLMTGERI